MRTAVGVAPGRLDFMGGVADYSGSLVLEIPTSVSTRVEITELATPVVRLSSSEREVFELSSTVLESLRQNTPLEWRQFLRRCEAPNWTHYVLGCLWLFAIAHNWWPESGLEFKIESAVPSSMGVSSSASLEVATLRALENWSGHYFSGKDLAHLAQRAENEVVGAPCGLMDQLAVAHGEPGRVLPILCRPDILGEPITLPEGIVVVGWPSGVKHAVADSPYATARAAAFMGKKWLEAHFGRKVDYLTEFPLADIQTLNEVDLPEQISGAEFLSKFESTDDPLSMVVEEKSYPLRSAVLFALEENDRCEKTIGYLRSGNLEAVGELMFESHAGYSSIGLGCPETDAMVDMVRKFGVKRGFYGARVSGGGSGGTVVLLGRAEALPQIKIIETFLIH